MVFFYALIASISIGVNGYLVKLLTDRRVEGAMFTFLQGMAYLIFGIGHVLYMKESVRVSADNTYPLILSIIIAIIIFINLRLRVRVLRYLSSSEYYISYRILLTISLVLIGMLFLRETITSDQLFGLILGSVGIVFLFEEDHKLRHSRNWKYASMLLLLSVGAWIGIQIFGKMQWLSHFSLPAMLVYQGMTMIGIALILDRKILKQYFSLWRIHFHNLILGVLATIFVYISAISVLNAYKAGGNMSIITKMGAYSLFIPIVLSVIFSWEKVTYKKTIAFILTIVSLYYIV